METKITSKNCHEHFNCVKGPFNDGMAKAWITVRAFLRQHGLKPVDSLTGLESTIAFLEDLIAIRDKYAPVQSKGKTHPKIYAYISNGQTRVYYDKTLKEVYEYLDGQNLSGGIPLFIDINEKQRFQYINHNWIFKEDVSESRQDEPKDSNQQFADVLKGLRDAIREGLKNGTITVDVCTD